MAPKITKRKHKPSSKPKPQSAAANPASEKVPSGLENDNSPLFFYGHIKGPYSFLSQHYACTFTAPALSFPSPAHHDAPAAAAASSTASDGAETLTFHTTEQYMMYHKALLFRDAASAAKIMATPSPGAQKALGRRVVGFDDEVWAAWRERIVEEGNWWKFRTGVSDAPAPDGGGEEGGLKEMLLRTGGRELVEASPRDRVWGVGFGRENAERMRGRWGLNLLGKALGRVRVRLREAEQREGGGMGGEKEGEKMVVGDE